MIVFLEILTLLSIFLLLYSYILYPALVRFLLFIRGKKYPVPIDGNPSVPRVSLIMSVYNEAAVIEDKLRSISAQSYPSGKLECFIGSDCSNDGTNEIIGDFIKERNQFHFFNFTSRRGKPDVINDLAATAIRENGKGARHILLFTDANVIMDPDLLKNLVRSFDYPDVAVVDTRMINTGVAPEDISLSEEKYISREVMLKYREGQLWGTMIGTFGGCFAVRSDYFNPVPPRFLVDDFFITLEAMRARGASVSDLDARCYEAVSHEIGEEYRRKARISAGNFQNLAHFSGLFISGPTAMRFSYFSHKVLRWIGPFLMIIAILGSAGLAFFSPGLAGLFQIIFPALAMFFFVAPVTDILFTALGIHIPILRHIRYFVVMNIALLEGFIRYAKGIEHNVWEPPKRDQLVSSEQH